MLQVNAATAEALRVVVADHDEADCKKVYLLLGAEKNFMVEAKAATESTQNRAAPRRMTGYSCSFALHDS